MEDMVAVAMPHSSAESSESQNHESGARVYVMDRDVVVARDVADGAIAPERGTRPGRARGAKRVVVNRTDQLSEEPAVTPETPVAEQVQDSAPVTERAEISAPGAERAEPAEAVEIAADADAEPTIGERPWQAARVIEALLFSSDAPVGIAKLAEIANCSQTQARLHIAELNDKYTSAGMSFRINEIARGYQFMTLPEFAEKIGQLHQQRKETRLGDAALETLSVVAYKQPIIRADVEAIRGVACGEVIKRLCELGLVRIVGRAEVVGRPLLYGTTRKFLDVFGLGDLEDLPPMEALRLKAGEANRAIPMNISSPSATNDAPQDPPLAAAGA